jgi:hypothetical protein
VDSDYSMTSETLGGERGESGPDSERRHDKKRYICQYASLEIINGL